MPTKMSIWNGALDILGRTSLNDDTTTNDSQLSLASIWTRSALLVLEEADWNSAIERVALSRLADAPAHGYSYYYQMPGGVARIVNINDTGVEDDELRRWKQEGEKIATDAEALYLWYVSSGILTTGIGRMSQALADYISADMAVRAAPRLANDRLEHAKQERDRARRNALSLDAKNAPVARLKPGTWSRARLGGIRNSAEQGDY